jgi:hypothetical protein
MRITYDERASLRHFNALFCKLCGKRKITKASVSKLVSQSGHEPSTSQIKGPLATDRTYLNLHTEKHGKYILFLVLVVNESRCFVEKKPFSDGSYQLPEN